MFNLIPLGYFNVNNMKKNFNFDNYTFKAAVKETDKGYILCAQLPGVNTRDIKVSYEKNYFTISIIKKHGQMSEGNNFKIVQSCYGKSSRSFYMEDINFKLIKASFKSDLLIIHIPKKGEYIQVNDSIKVR